MSRARSSNGDAWPTADVFEVLRISPDASKGGLAVAEGEGPIIVLPGNPGVPGYYRHFAEGLSEALGAEVVILGFCGHTLKPRVAPWKVFSLQDQVEHVVGYVDHHHGEHRPLRIVGHSIGAYVAMEAMKRRPKVVSHVLGILPFLENNDADPSFQKMSRLALLPSPIFWPALGAICAVLAVVQLLPFGARRALARLQTGGFDPEYIDFTADAMLQPGVFANYAYMGRTELRNHARRWDFLAQLGASAADGQEAASAELLARRVRLLYTDGDFWAPEAFVPAAEAAGVRAELHKGLPHAFSVRKRSCDWVTDWSAQQLRDLVDASV